MSIWQRPRRGRNDRAPLALDTRRFGGVAGYGHRRVPFGSGAAPWRPVVPILLFALSLPLLLTSCYTQVRDPSLRVPGELSRREEVRRRDIPNEGTLVLVVDRSSMRLEQWVMVESSPWLAGGPDLELQVEGARESRTLSFHYPGSGAVVYRASMSGRYSPGQILFPSRWRLEGSLPLGGRRTDPSWIRVYSGQGAGRSVYFSELPHAHESGRELLELWREISDREIVADWVEDGAWIGVHRQLLSTDGMTEREKWIVFIRG